MFYRFRSRSSGAAPPGFLRDTSIFQLLQRELNSHTALHKLTSFFPLFKSLSRTPSPDPQGMRSAIDNPPFSQNYFSSSLSSNSINYLNLQFKIKIMEFTLRFKSFRDIDFDLPVKKVDVEASRDGDAVGRREEDVADYLAIAERMIRDEFADSAAYLVGQQDEELAAGVSEYLVISVALHLRLIPNLETFPSIIDSRDKLVHLGITIEISPQDFPILWIIAPRIVLLGPVIDNGDTNRSKGHSIDNLIMFLLVIPIATPAQDSGIVVVVDEVAEIVQLVSIDATAPFAVVIAEVCHVFHVEYCVSDPEEERIIEHCIEGAQIASKIAHIAIEDFSNCVDASRILKLPPEPFRHFRDRINSDTIKVILLNEISDPFQQLGPHPVILLLEIGQAGEPAVFDSVLVLCGEVVVGDDAEAVVMVRGVEGHILAVVLVEVAHVIGHDIHHHPDIPFVTGTHKIFEVLLRAKVPIKLINIPAPISMVAPISVINNRTDPDSIEAHTLDIVEIVLQSDITSSAVPAQVIAALLTAIIAGESVGQHLVDCPGLPLFGCGCQGLADQQGGQQEGHQSV